jgi:nucleotide-binding universal stress UspA family protein
MRCILIPLDGSSFAEQAIPVAVGIARRTGASLEFVAVHEVSPAARIEQGTLSFDWRFDADLKRELGQYLLRTQAATLKGEPSLTVRSSLVEGPVVATIVQHAREVAADLIVLTTHGLSGPSRTWLGSVSDALVRTSGVPVLAVRPRDDATQAERAFAIRRALIALDGTRDSESAIESAITVAGTPDVQYVVLRVVVPLHPFLRAVGTSREYERDRREQRALAQEYTNAVVGQLRERGIDARSEVREDVNPARAILRVAEEIEADVLALATHGRGPFGRMLLGGVADKVLRGALTPVLLHCSTMAPARGEESDSPAERQR